MKTDYTKQEIQKLLYKHNPIANLYAKPNAYYLYDAIIDDLQIMFAVPVSEMGEKLFDKTEPAKLLVRWYDRCYNIWTE